MATYLGQIRALVESREYPGAVLRHLLAPFQPFYEAHLLRQGPDQRPLFQAGAWLVNLRLAAAAGEQALLRQGDPVRYFHDALQRLGAPKGGVGALEQLAQIMEKPEITERDARRILKLVKKVQTILG